MGTNFLHGAEVREVATGARPIPASGATVIGIAGIAPDGPSGAPVVTLGASEARETWGAAGSIPAAIAAVHSQGRAPAIAAVNALDAARHRTDANAKRFTFDSGDRIQLDHARVSDVVVSDDNPATAPNTHDEGADYALDAASGALTRVAAGGIAAGANVYVAYKWVDESKVTRDDVVAAIARLGEAETSGGSRPDVVIAPGWSEKVDRAGLKVSGAPVAAALAAVADRLRAIAVCDAPGTTRLDALDYRAALGSRRAYVVDPKVRVPGAGGALEDAPASGYVAGLIARVDADPDAGWWHSPSNREILGIAGTSRFVSFGLGDADSEANLLNASEVATIVRASGYRLWGNRTAGSDPKFAFLSVVRTNDRINESILEAHLWAVDKNITRDYVASVVEGVNNYLRGLVAQGAILGGRCWADPDLNPAGQVAGGELYLDYEFTPAYPAERLVFRSHLVDGYAETIF